MATWIKACDVDDVAPEDMLRFVHDGRILLIVRSPEGSFHCIDGICSHEKVELSGGLVMDHQVECPKHSGCFDYRSGEAMRAPACVNLKTWATKVEGQAVYVQI